MTLPFSRKIRASNLVAEFSSHPSNTSKTKTKQQQGGGLGNRVHIEDGGFPCDGCLSRKIQEYRVTRKQYARRRKQACGIEDDIRDGWRTGEFKVVGVANDSANSFDFEKLESRFVHHPSSSQ